MLFVKFKAIRRVDRFAFVEFAKYSFFDSCGGKFANFDFMSVNLQGCITPFAKEGKFMPISLKQILDIFDYSQA